MYHAPNAPTNSTVAATIGLDISAKDDTMTNTVNIETEACLARRGTLPVLSQFRRLGPNHLWPKSQSSNRLLPFLKQQSPRIMNIVVGSPGTTIPAKPAPTLKSPNVAQNQRGSLTDVILDCRRVPDVTKTFVACPI
jgi:hypothetical protein